MIDQTEGMRILSNDILVDLLILTPTLEELPTHSRVANITDSHGRAMAILQRTIITSVARVIGVGSVSEHYQDLKAGDFVSLDDGFSRVTLNPRWLEWQDRLRKEQPPPEGIAPRMYNGMIIDFQNRNPWIFDKAFKFEPDTLSTFLLKEVYCKTLLTEKWILANLGSEIFSIRKNG